jgi:hypothetical protein
MTDPERRARNAQFARSGRRVFCHRPSQISFIQYRMKRVSHPESLLITTGDGSSSSEFSRKFGDPENGTFARRVVRHKELVVGNAPVGQGIMKVALPGFRDPDENGDQDESSRSALFGGERPVIESLGLRNFKNFRDAALPLGSFSVLIGANASGKSNVQATRSFRRADQSRS